VQIVELRGIGFRQRSGEEIGLLLVVAFDRDAVARFDDRFEQCRRAVGRAELSATDLCASRQPGSAISPLS
jgi:hypothetical protein